MKPFTESPDIHDSGRRRTGRTGRILRETWSAVRGVEMDYTTGSIGRAIFVLSVPMVLEMLMESIFAVTDIFFVSKLGPGAVAVVGVTESMLTLIYAVAIGLSMGTTAMVARRIGEKRADQAGVAAVQAIVVGLVASVPVAAAGVVFAPNLLGLMGVENAVAAGGWKFTAVMFGGNAVIMLIFIINAVFRGAGDAVIAMRVLWIANGINIVLDPCLIFGWGPFPALGVTGAAVATTIGRGIGVAFQLWVLFRGRGRIRLRAGNVRVVPVVMGRLVRISLGGIGQFLIATSSWIGLIRIIATFGSEALAGYTIAVRIAMFTLLPAWGMSGAAATLVGQNLGAAQPDRAERSVWRTGLATMVFLAAVGVVFILFAESVVRLFTGEPEVVAVGAEALRFFSYGYAAYAYGMVMVQAFNGAGDTNTPTVINLFCFWLLEIPLAYVLALVAGLGERGVFISVLVSESLMGLVAIAIFRRGWWKTREV